MMNKLPFYIVALLVLSSGGCYEGPPVYHTYKGRCLVSCDNPEPVAGVTLQLEHFNGDVTWGGTHLGVVAETVTDEDGYFVFTFLEETKQGDYSIFRTGSDGTHSPMEATAGPTTESVSGLVLYGYPKNVFRISTENTAALSAVDSVVLFIQGMSADEKILVTSQNVQSQYFLETIGINLIKPEIFSGGTPRVRYGVWKDGIFTSTNSPAFNLSPCDTMDITVDFAEIIP